MKKIISKVIAIVSIFCILATIVTMSVSAAGTTIAFSKSTVSTSNTVTVTVNYTASEAMTAIQSYLKYDSNLVEFVSGNDCNLLSPGNLKIIHDVNNKTSDSLTFTFKAKVTGTANFTVDSVSYVNASDIENGLSSSSANLNIKDKSAAASSNANLSLLKPSSGTLVPKFSANVTEYTLTIPNDVAELWLSYNTADASAKTKVEGDRFMEVGQNKRTVVVTAENGTVKRYVVNITRLDENGNIPNDTEVPEEKYIEVTVDDKTLYIDETFTEDIVLDGFTLTDFSYNETVVPAITDGKYTLVRLVTLDGSEADFYIVSADGKFERLLVLMVGGKNYLIFTPEGLPEGYTLSSDTIEGLTVPVYISKDPAFEKYPLVFAKGPGGETCFYRYDKLDGTIQRVIDTEISLITEENPTKEEDKQTDIIAVFTKLTLSEKIVAITVLAVIVLLIAAIVILIVKIATPSEKSIAKKQKKAKKAEQDVLEDPEPVSFDFVSVADMQENIEDSFDITEETDEPAAEEITQPEEEEETESDSNDDELGEEPEE